MAIVGLTVSETGENIQRLAVSTRVAIGERVSRNGKTFPSKLDHFIFLRKSSSLEWERDPILEKHYGECRKISIVLVDDLPENVFVTEYAWWGQKEKKCWGDGRSAIRRTEKNRRGQDWKPCGEGCQDLDRGDCKPSGDLYFILQDFPKLGSICKLHTTSYRSIRQLHSSLAQISSICGRLAGLRVNLVVRPEKTTYVDDASVKYSTTIYALNLELGGDDTKKLLAKTQLALSESTAAEHSEDPQVEQDRQAQELYPVVDIAPAKEIARGPSARITKDQRLELVKISAKIGWSHDQCKTILREKFGVNSSAEITPEQFDAVCARLGTYQAIDEDIPF